MDIKFLPPIAEQMKPINMYDFDGVVSIGVNPSSSEDVIVTGRCRDESEYVFSILRQRGIKNAVYFNPLTLQARGFNTEFSRKHSGVHKANIISMFKKANVRIKAFFEDDQLQAAIIKANHEDLEIVLLDHNLVNK